jgi:hypothetical protein
VRTLSTHILLPNKSKVIFPTKVIEEMFEIAVQYKENIREEVISGETSKNHKT